MFKTMDEFKARAQFFPGGRIIPQRILKGPRWIKRRITFGTDCWAIPTPKGYLVASDSSTGNGAAVTLNNGDGFLSRNGDAWLTGSPYTPGGNTHWIGNTSGDERQLEQINAHLRGE